MREQIAEIICDAQDCYGTIDCFGASDQILVLFREEISKLKVLEPSEIEAVIREDYPVFELNEEGEEYRKATILKLAQASLTKFQEDLLKEIGK